MAGRRGVPSHSTLYGARYAVMAARSSRRACYSDECYKSARAYARAPYKRGITSLEVG